MIDKQILENGYQALSQDLGINFLYFIQQFYKGHGDYTKEKYEKPDEIIDWDKLEAEINKCQ